MGADNLAQLPRWRKWRGILAGCPVAVFERHPYSYAALSGPVARGFAAAQAAGGPRGRAGAAGAAGLGVRADAPASGLRHGDPGGQGGRLRA